MNQTKITNYNEEEQLSDLLQMCQGIDTMDSVLFDQALKTLIDNGVKYPPFKPGQTCYYLYKKDLEESPTEYMWEIASAQIRQISWNDFGFWALLEDMSLQDLSTWGEDIFSSYALAQLHCERRNSLINPEV